MCFGGCGWGGGVWFSFWFAAIPCVAREQFLFHLAFAGERFFPPIGVFLGHPRLPGPSFGFHPNYQPWDLSNPLL